MYYYVRLIMSGRLNVPRTPFYQGTEDALAVPRCETQERQVQP